MGNSKKTKATTTLQSAPRRTLIVERDAKQKPIINASFDSSQPAVESPIDDEANGTVRSGEAGQAIESSTSSIDVSEECSGIPGPRRVETQLSLKSSLTLHLHTRPRGGGRLRKTRQETTARLPSDSRSASASGSSVPGNVQGAQPVIVV